MIIAIFIAVYILTVIFEWFMTLKCLQEEQVKVTVGDTLTNMPWIMYVPIINTILLTIFCIAHLIWNVFGIGTLCEKLWNKLKDIEL